MIYLVYADTGERVGDHGWGWSYAHDMDQAIRVLDDIIPRTARGTINLIDLNGRILGKRDGHDGRVYLWHDGHWRLRGARNYA